MIFSTKVFADSAEYLGEMPHGDSVFRVILDADKNMRFDLGPNTTNYTNLKSGVNILRMTGSHANGTAITLTDADSGAILFNGTVQNAPGSFSFNNFTEEELNEIAHIQPDMMSDEFYPLSHKEHLIQTYLNTQNTNSAENQANTNASNIANINSNISTNQTAVTNNATNISTNTTNISTNTTNINTNAANISTNAANISSNSTGVAEAMAISTMQFDLNYDGFQAAFGYATFNGKEATAIMMGKKIDKNLYLTISATESNNGAIAFNFKF